MTNKTAASTTLIQLAAVQIFFYFIDEAADFIGFLFILKTVAIERPPRQQTQIILTSQNRDDYTFSTNVSSPKRPDPVPAAYFY